MTKEELKNKQREAQKRYREKNKETIKKRAKKYREENKDKTSESYKKWANKNKENVKVNRKKNYELNKEKEKINKKTWSNNNREKLRSTQREYHKTEKRQQYLKKNSAEIKVKRNKYLKNKHEKDPLFKLSHCIRSGILSSFKSKNFKKSHKTTIILGCSFLELKQYLESKFEPWMTWDNHGKINNNFPTATNQSWDVDHIIPLSSAKTEEEFVKLNHYTNLQPLCSYTNRFIKRDIV